MAPLAPASPRHWGTLRKLRREALQNIRAPQAWTVGRCPLILLTGNVQLWLLAPWDKKKLFSFSKYLQDVSH